MFHPKLRRLFFLLRSTRCLLATIALLTLFCIYLRTYPSSNNGEGDIIMESESRTSNSDGPLAKVLLHPLVTHKQEEGEQVEERIPVLVISANREKAVASHLDQLKRLRLAVGGVERFPIIVSQDGDAAAVTGVIKQFVAQNKNTFFIQHKERKATPGASKSVQNYGYIAQHYKWALDKLFTEMGHKVVSITEEDLDLSTDFFSYFSATRPLLYEDPTVWCISAWNDNGAPSLADHSKSARLYRTDFFPGLGWMLTAELWRELSPKWPAIYWDDWMRQPSVRRGRACIRPEISRTLHNMSLAGKGSSNALYKAYLNSIKLPEQPVNFSLVDMTHLKKSIYDRQYGARILHAKEIPLEELVDKGTPPASSAPSGVRVIYRDPRDFRKIARKFGLMNDIRSGMPRTSYYGAVSFTNNGVRVHALHTNLNLSKPFGSMPAEEIYEGRWDLMSKYLDFSEVYCKAGRWTGKCDPKDEDMVAWFRKSNQMKRLTAWGEMIVF